MKTLLIFLFVVLSASAQETVSVILTWDANLEPDVSGYRIYVGTSSQVYGPAILVEGITKTLTLPKDTLHFAVVTAVNTSGLESVPSKELCFQVYRPGEGRVPSPPTNLRKVGALQVSIEQSSDLQIWSRLYSQVVQQTSSQTFYRTVVSQ